LEVRSAVVCFRKRYPTLCAMRLRKGWGTRCWGWEVSFVEGEID
jgi:hypothetical protein